MKLELGKKYNIREPGHEDVQYAIVAGTLDDSCYPYRVNYYDKENSKINTDAVTNAGHYQYFNPKPHPLDLVSEYEEPSSIIPTDELSEEELKDLIALYKAFKAINKRFSK